MTTPPFRADHVGSLLRPKRAARGARAGTPRARPAPRSCARSRTRASARSVGRQEEVGLEGITDGEFRRTFFHVDFLEQLAGVSVEQGSFSASFRRDDGTEVGFRPPVMRITGPLRHQGRSRAGLRFPRRAARPARPRSASHRPRCCISAAAARRSTPRLSRPRDFYADLAAAYRAEIADLAARGCRYLQLDDTNLAYLCDPKIRDATRARGDDPDQLPRTYCRLINAAIRGRPGRHGGLHPPLPRQLPQRLGRLGRLRAGRRDPVQRARARRLLPRVRRRPLGRLRPAPLRAAGQDRGARHHDQQAPRAREQGRADPRGSRRRPATSRSSSWRSARNAASPPPSTATSSPRTTSGASSRASSRSQARSGPPDFAPRPLPRDAQAWPCSGTCSRPEALTGRRRALPVRRTPPPA